MDIKLHDARINREVLEDYLLTNMDSPSIVSKVAKLDAFGNIICPVCGSCYVRNVSLADPFKFRCELQRHLFRAEFQFNGGVTAIQLYFFDRSNGVL